MQNQTKQSNTGFSMIEVLVTMVIVALALFGAAGLQAYAMKTNLGGQNRNQAVFLMSDIVDRMEANKAAATAGLYASAGVKPAASNACNVAACASGALATYDIGNWLFQVQQVLPQGTATLVSNGATTTVTINWVDRASNKNGAGSTEAFSVTTTRTIR